MSPRPLRLGAFLVVLGPMFVVACKPPPESIKVNESVYGPPDLVKPADIGEVNRAFQLRAFHFNHVWAGAAGRTELENTYRAKITVWDYNDETTPLAELYFHDDAAGTALPSSDPHHAKRPFQVHFSSTVLMPILSTLRNTNEPTYLYYYHGAWALGTYEAEPVGSD